MSILDNDIDRISEEAVDIVYKNRVKGVGMAFGLPIGDDGYPTWWGYNMVDNIIYTPGHIANVIIDDGVLCCVAFPFSPSASHKVGAQDVQNRTSKMKELDIQSFVCGVEDIEVLHKAHSTIEKYIKINNYHIGHISEVYVWCEAKDILEADKQYISTGCCTAGEIRFHDLDTTLDLQQVYMICKKLNLCTKCIYVDKLELNNNILQVHDEFMPSYIYCNHTIWPYDWSMDEWTERKEQFFNDLNLRDIYQIKSNGISSSSKYSIRKEGYVWAWDEYPDARIDATKNCYDMSTYYTSHNNI